MAGFTSSLKGLSRFASWQSRLLQNGGKEVLDANTFREMHRVHWADLDWKITWGLGFAVYKAENATAAGHDGACLGYISQFLMISKYKIAAVVLTSASGGPAGKEA